MATGISWTDETWNPTTGCDRISPGCDHCYALKMAKRLKGMGRAKYQNDGDPRTSGPGFGLTLHPDALTVPLRWRKPRRVFVNSMSDLGHARVPAAFLASVWAVMAATPQHTYQILSKRPERMRMRLNSHGFELLASDASFGMELDVPEDISWPLPNVWLGTSIELDRYTRRADDLRETLAAVRFLSLEPLLGPLPSLDLSGIDWTIIGGESGPDYRQMDLGWVRDLIAQGRETGTAIFVKQDSGPKSGMQGRIPDELWLKEFPSAAEVVTA